MPIKMIALEPVDEDVILEVIDYIRHHNAAT